jgi:hypothetical protein
MAWFWAFLIFYVVVMAGSLGFGYIAAEQIIGGKAARRNLRYMFPWLLFGFALTTVLPALGKYGWISFHLLYAVGISVWLIRWFPRKQNAGSLLQDIGRTSQNKFIFRVSLAAVAVSILQTWSFFTLIAKGIPEYVSLDLEMSKLIFWWSFASFLIATGLNRLEFRENGICFMYSLIQWQRINSYTWEPAKPNVLTIRFKPRFPLLPGFMSMAIPPNHRDEVSHILDERLPDKDQ